MDEEWENKPLAENGWFGPVGYVLTRKEWCGVGVHHLKSFHGLFKCKSGE